MNQSNNPSAIRSKNEITTALLHLMEQYPYSDITVKQIVLESGIAHKTFYRNFDSKNDVLDAYINRIMIDYVEQLKNLKNCKMPDILDVIFALCQEYQTLLILLYNNNLSHILLNKWNTFIPEVHEEIVTTDKPFYQKCNTVNVSYILAFNIGSIWNIITKWIANDMKETPEEIKDTIVAYLKDIAFFI